MIGKKLARALAQAQAKARGFHGAFGDFHVWYGSDIRTCEEHRWPPVARGNPHEARITSASWVFSQAGSGRQGYADGRGAGGAEAGHPPALLFGYEDGHHVLLFVPEKYTLELHFPTGSKVVTTIPGLEETYQVKEEADRVSVYADRSKLRTAVRWFYDTEVCCNYRPGQAPAGIEIFRIGRESS